MTAEMFPLLGVPPLLGRVFSAEETRAGHEREVVLGYALWQRRFGGDRGVLDTSVLLDGSPYTIVGVMPEKFRFAPFWATRASLWAPLALESRATSRNGSSLRVFARLKKGVPVAQARAEMAAITSRLEALLPGHEPGPSGDSTQGKGGRRRSSGSPGAVVCRRVRPPDRLRERRAHAARARRGAAQGGHRPDGARRGAVEARAPVGRRA